MANDRDTAARVEPTQAEMNSRQSIPAFAIIIGAMKSGTTTLFDALAQHPEVSPAKEKEPGFFGLEEVWSRGFDWYESLWNFDPSTHKVALEASTDYTKYPFCDDAAARMADCTSCQFKLIYLMRDPLERIESHARHVDGVKMELGRRISEQSDHSLDAGISELSLAASRYATQIGHFDRFHKEGNLLLLVLEDYSADPIGTLKQVCRFLGIDEQFQFDVSRRSNIAGSRKRLHPVAKMVLRSSAMISVLRSLVPEAIKPWIKRKAAVPVRATGRYVLKRDEEQDLRSQLAAEISRLETDYGVNTSRWQRYHGNGSDQA